jgi:predicted DNA-binding protein (MmcQ/YjbR family)
MNIEELREYCLQLPFVTEGTPFGPDVLVFKVHEKIFALAGISNIPTYVNLKCDPDRAVELREQYPDITPGYHMNKQHWNSVVTEGELTRDLLLELIRHSYNLVYASLPKKLRDLSN